MERLSWSHLVAPVSCLALLSVVSAARAAAPSPRVNPREIMRVQEVRPGMRGIGLTVFRGVKIEKFDVTVLGVLPKQSPALGRPQILVRMSGGPISERSANIIGGMSGSPVYINGRLVGAIAYGYEFPREPIAMITPIEDMLEALDPALPAKPSWASQRRAKAPAPAPPAEPSVQKLDPPVRVGGQVFHRVRITARPFHLARQDRREPGTLVMAPLATPALVSGVSARGLQRFSQVFAPLGVEPIAGPGPVRFEKPIPLVPGAAAGASLIIGDVDMTAVGTVTYRKGNQVLAFGHPFMQLGAVDLPLSTAWVHDVFPSIMRSFKIASPVKVVGRVRQDRPWGVSAVTGQTSELIPVEAVVRDHGTGRRQTIRARVVDNRFLTPQLVAMVANEAILRVHSVPGDATARVRTQILTDALGPIERENLFYDATAIDAAALGDLAQGLGLLSNNQWEQVNVRGVKMVVDIDRARRTAVIERAAVDRDRYEPGDTIRLDVTVRPWEKEPVRQTLLVKIPEYAPNGRVTLRVSGGAGGGILLAPAGAGTTGAPGGQVRIGVTAPLPPATSLEQLVQRFRERERNDEIVARLTLPTFAASVNGQEMHTLPPSLLDVMRSPRNSALQLQNDEVKVSQATPWVVSGAAAVTLNIERRSYAEKPDPTPAPAPAPDRTPSGEPAARPALGDEADLSTDILGEGIEPGGLRKHGAPGGETGVLSAGWSTAANSALPVALPGPASDAAAQKPPTPAGAAAAAQDQESRGAGGNPAPQQKPQGDDGAKVRSVARAPVVWRQNTAEAFARGRLEGLALSEKGTVTLAPAIRRVASLDASYVWSLLSADGALYAGTGDRGMLYQVRDGKVKPLLSSGELQVLALARDAAGNVYAGTAPHGLVYRLSPDGKSRVLWRSPEEYILSLCVDAHGVVYAGTSPHGRIYRISPEGKGSLLARVPDPYVISLAHTGGSLYAGTGASGAVFQIGADGKVSTLFDPGQGDTASLVAAGPNGRLFVGTSPRGAVYAVDPDGRDRLLHEKSPAGISALAVDAQGVVWAAAGQAIYRIEETAGPPQVERVEDPLGSRFLAVAIDPAGAVVLGTATGELYGLAGEPSARGVLESAVRDAGSVARWGRLTWNAKTPAGTRVALQTRTGNSPEPDATWSPWSPEYAQSGATVVSPPGRYFQYRALLTSDRPGVRPSLLDVAVVYLPRNREPQLTVAAPKSGDVWARQQTIRWNGTDPDKDTLVYDLYLSSDEGSTWKRLNGMVKPADAASTPPSAPALGPRQRASDSLRETSCTWDTTSVPDGRYFIRIVASDRLSNPSDPATAEQVIGPILIANTPPRLNLAGDPVADADRSVSVSGSVQAGVPLAGVEYRVDEEEWSAAVAEDGIFDGEAERFALRTAALDAGEHTLEVRAVDAAGNHTIEKRKVMVK